MEKINSKSPILVTGMHRSGTTWVGKMLSAHPKLSYISEPLNIFHRPGVMKTKTEFWYTYITKDREDEFLDAYRDTFKFRYHLLKEIRSLRSWKDFFRIFRDSTSFFIGRIDGSTPLIKDPFAVFSIPWFIEHFNTRAVITIRHPCAVVSSLKRTGWSFDFNHLLSQSELVEDHLKPYTDEMNSLLDDPEDIIGQGSLLWKIIYSQISKIVNKLPELITVRHEDLSLDPIVQYSKLFKKLDLEFSEKISSKIEFSSSPKNLPEAPSNKIHSYKIDSRKNVLLWKERLNQDEIRRVKDLTEPVLSEYYPEADLN